MTATAAAAKAALAFKRRREAAEKPETVETDDKKSAPVAADDDNDGDDVKAELKKSEFVTPGTSSITGPKKSSSDPKPKKATKKFEYGNYNRYYGYRNPGSQLFPGTLEDPRLFYFKPEWFFGKDVLVSFYSIS